MGSTDSVSPAIALAQNIKIHPGGIISGGAADDTTDELHQSMARKDAPIIGSYEPGFPSFFKQNFVSSGGRILVHGRPLVFARRGARARPV